MDGGCSETPPAGPLSCSSRNALKPLSNSLRLLPISRPAVSQHLKVLKDSGLVAEHAEGTRRIYHLNETGLTALRDQLDTFWNRALANYQDVIDESPKENP